MSSNYSNANSMNAQSGNIYRANSVDFSKFTFSEPTANKYGGRSSRVKYAGQDFYIQAPRMRLPYGLGKWVDTTNPDKVKYSIDFSLAGFNKNKPEEYNPRIGEFFEFLNNLQKCMIDNGVKNAVTWFGKPSETVRKSIDNDPDTYIRDLIKYPKDKQTKQVTDKYPPTFKAHVVTWDNKFIIKAYDDAGQEVRDFETSFVKGTEAVAILKLKAASFQGKSAGLKFDLVQIKLYRPASIPDYAFIEDDNDSKPIRQSASIDEDEDVESKQGYSNNVEDSDDEPTKVRDELDDDNDEDEENDEDDEEERPPTPPPAKKNTTKKTTTSSSSDLKPKKK
jgi:hypothetical protein